MTRSPWGITLSVWHALLLREAVSRMFGRRAALVWLFTEPIANIAFMAFVFTIFRASHIGGMHFVLWVTSGMLAFLLFRRTASQGTTAVGSNLALFTYRQVKPVDTVLVRSLLEALLMFLTAVLIFSSMALMNIPLGLHDPIHTLTALLGLWLLGVGWGLAASVATELVPELSHLIDLVMTPLLVISGVIVPLSAIHYPWREWLMYNPIAHGIEGVRTGISPYYHHAPELNLNYLMGSALCIIFLGLVLQRRFRNRMVSL